MSSRLVGALVTAIVAIAGAWSSAAPPSASAQPIRPEDVPAPLRPWVPWVLDGVATHGCTFVGEEQVCSWPGELRLDLGPSGGSFELAVVSDRATEVPLPGGADHFPRNVRV